VFMFFHLFNCSDFRTSVRGPFVPSHSNCLSMVYKFCKRLAVDLQLDFTDTSLYSPTCMNLSKSVYVRVYVDCNFVPLWMFIILIFI
jgi:hypothetical protein